MSMHLLIDFQVSLGKHVFPIKKIHFSSTLPNLVNIFILLEKEGKENLIVFFLMDKRIYSETTILNTLQILECG